MQLQRKPMQRILSPARPNATSGSRFPHHHPWDYCSCASTIITHSSTSYGSYFCRCPHHPVRRCDRSFLKCFRHQAPPNALLHHSDGTLWHLETKIDRSPHQNHAFTSKISVGLIAGGIDVAVGNPANVVMVCMQADGRLPAAHCKSFR